MNERQSIIALHTPAEPGYVFVLVMGVIDRRWTDGHKVTPAAHAVAPHPVNRMCHRVQCSSIQCHTAGRGNPHDQYLKARRGTIKTDPEALHSYRQLPKIGRGRVYSLSFESNRPQNVLLASGPAVKVSSVEFVHKSRHR